MCLAVPGRVVHWVRRDALFAEAVVEFGLTRRSCQMACVPEVEIDDYVLVHAGIAITRMDSEEAERILNELRSLNEFDGPDGGGNP